MFQLAVDALSYGEEWTTTNSDWLSSFLQEGVQYVEFTNVLALYGQAITIVIDGALSGLQMVFLSVPPGAPLSLVQPTNQAIFEGSTATFNFATGGASPLAYQWLFNGIAIAGATNTSYSLTNAQITNAGQYSVMVTNLYGTLVSQAATLTVYDNASAGTLINVAFTGRPPTAKKGIAAIGATPIDFWNTSTPFWTNVYFADGAPSGTFLFATFTGGLFAGVYNNGATDPMYGTYVWTLDGSVTGSILIEITNLAPGGYDFYLYGHGNQDDQNGVFTLSVGSLSYGTEQTTTNAGWISPVWQEGVQYVEFTNVVVSAQQMVIITVALGASQYAVLSGLQMAALSVSSSSPFFVAPATSQTQSVTLGSTATFSVVASGAEPLTYQWMLNNSFIFGATNSNLTITNAQLTNSGNYFVIVNNAYGSLASPETALNVIVPVARVIDVAFTGDPVTGKTGFAATGVGPNDFWNTYVLGSGSLARLKFMDGTISDAGLAVANVAGFAGNGASDPMYGTYCVSEYEGNMTVTITNLDAGLYDLYFYGHGNYNSENSIFQLTVRSVDLGSKATINGPEYDSSVWQEGVQYVEFTNVTIAGQTVTVTVEPGGSAWGTLCGLQIVPLVLPSNKPPIMVSPSNQLASINQELIITTYAFSSSVPISFILASNAPEGAGVTSDGVFTWTPTCEQGGTTNLITIWAIDSSSPPLSNSITFTVAVGNCVEVGIGSSVAEAGQATCVPVNVFTTVGLTNLSFSLAATSGFLTNWTVSSTNPTVASATVGDPDGLQPQFNFRVQNGQVLQGASVIGSICLDTLNGDSAFVPLLVANLGATTSNSAAEDNLIAQNGRIVVIGPQPLLGASLDSNLNPVLTLYGQPDTTYDLLSTSNLIGGGSWSSWTNATLSGLSQSIRLGSVTNQMQFFRAVQP